MQVMGHLYKSCTQGHTEQKHEQDRKSSLGFDRRSKLWNYLLDENPSPHASVGGMSAVRPAIGMSDNFHILRVCCEFCVFQH